MTLLVRVPTNTNVSENAADDCNGGDRGQMKYENEAEDADKEFNYVMKIDDFDNLYLL